MIIKKTTIITKHLKKNQEERRNNIQYVIS